jgi:mono/diheme cytochrome c family protein
MSGPLAGVKPRIAGGARPSPVAALSAAALLALTALQVSAASAESQGAARFHKEVQPILKQFCYDCHGDGMKKGDVAFDQFKSDAELLAARKVWWMAMKNLRAGIMPPPKKSRPSEDQRRAIERWIKSSVFGIDPRDLDPGRVTVRRLNRVEYRNTIRDLMGVEFNTDSEFPPDDTGFGFDNIGDVLSLSPMLLEKYMGAAETIIGQAVPKAGLVEAEEVVPGRQFHKKGEGPAEDSARSYFPLSYYETNSISASCKVKHDGQYTLVLDLKASEKFVDNVFDQNKCRLAFKVDGTLLMNREFVREGGKEFKFDYALDWSAGAHELALEVEPLTPDAKQVRSLELRIISVTIRGPAEKKYWVRPGNYEKFFTRKEVPSSPDAQREYAGELLGSFARKAFRRPVDETTVKRLVDLAESVYQGQKQPFEAGVGQAMAAVLASPRFLFREEGIEPGMEKNPRPLLDEYSLASRLSYFLWSSMPDDELFRLAAQGSLRKQLPQQVKRMLDDSRSKALVQNFAGQWLESRDIDKVVIDARSVLAREDKPDPEKEKARARFRNLRNRSEESLTEAEKDELSKLRAEFFRVVGRGLRADMTGEIRQAMRQETERYFEYVIRQDRPLEEFIESDYTFLNERLAKHYGVENVTGPEMRRVTLPAGSPRGGILTQGTILAVTSNPTRTSPVKRGVFVLDNVLGLPPPPPPPNIPALEDSIKPSKDHEPSLRETLAIHRQQPLCSSCHDRMDPLGLALENFNAMGMWRTQERGQPIEIQGKLASGESFENVQELKHILATNHRSEFYRCVTEKLLIYALGRALDYYDVQTVDNIVERLEKEHGRFSVLLDGVIESTPFQKRRNSGMVTKSQPQPPAKQRAEAKNSE